MSKREAFINYNSGKLWSCSSGFDNAPAILLCNGGPGCCDYLNPVAEMLDDKYRVIRFEQRGCGRSTADGQYDLFTAVEDIERVRIHWGIERWVVGGHSWGANLAFVYAMTYPERVQALLYIAGNGVQNDRHWSEEYHRNRDEHSEPQFEMKYPFNDDVNAEGNRTLRELGRTPDFYLRVSKMNVSALFVMAENDMRPNWPAMQLANLMPNAQYVIIKGVSHNLWLDNTESLREVLSEYLEDIS